MPLPIFNSQGLLPPIGGSGPTDRDRSPYIVTMSELVNSFGTTPHRQKLLRYLLTYRQLMYAGGYSSGLQFLDGSFVENVEAQGREPRDIDVFSLVHLPDHYKKNPSSWHQGGFQFWAEEIQNQPKNKDRFKLDTYAALVEEFQLLGLLQNVMYWYSLFSHQRDTFAWKGFVAVLLDQAQDVEALTILGEG